MTTNTEHVPNRLLEKDSGPWWLVKCDTCDWSGWTSAYGQAEVEGMKHEDENFGIGHNVSIHKNGDESRDHR